jgi:YHS domain-containing protein
MSRVSFARSKVLAASLLGLAIVATGNLQSVKADHIEQPRIGLGGYCPVCILDANKWAKGSTDHQATYDGVTYYFPEETIKQTFLAKPGKYVPALGGDCIVCYAKLGKRVPGSVNHTARYDNRLFLFVGAEQPQAFVSNPTEFANADLALNGDCAVCLAHHKKHVAGKPEFPEIKDGFRYLFVSAREKAAFREDPAAYVAPASKPAAMESKTSQRPAGNGSLTVTGKTTCAGCEHGVTPIQNPEELGLSANTDDGRVVIVEQAHQLYRSAYENRYAGEHVRVSGRVIKQQGRFTWIEPTELMVQKLTVARTPRVRRCQRRALVRGWDSLIFDLHEYKGQVTWTAPVNFSSAANTKLAVQGTVFAQACQDDRCLAPKSHEFKAALRADPVPSHGRSSQGAAVGVSDASEPLAAASHASAPADADARTEAPPPTDGGSSGGNFSLDQIELTAAQSGFSSVWAILPLVFAAGFLLNLMPCVLPVVGLNLLDGVLTCPEPIAQAVRWARPSRGAKISHVPSTTARAQVVWSKNLVITHSAHDPS